MISQNFELHKEKSGLKKLLEEEERDPDHRASSPRSIAQSSTAATSSSLSSPVSVSSSLNVCHISLRGTCHACYKIYNNSFFEEGVYVA